MSDLYPLTWLADVLRAGGCRVVEESGWKTRGRPSSSGSFHPKALLRHWDASAPGSHGAISTVINGSSSAPGPLCSILTCRGNSDHAASVHVIAAGRANHGGEGDGWGVIPVDGANTYAVGHEIAQTVDQPWPADQLDQVRKAEAAILKRLGAKTGNALCAHSEYAPGRKIDTTEGSYGQDMNAERRAVQRIIDGGGAEDDMRQNFVKLTSGGFEDALSITGRFIAWDGESSDSGGQHYPDSGAVHAPWDCVMTGHAQVHVTGPGTCKVEVQRHKEDGTYVAREALGFCKQGYSNVPFTASFTKDQLMYVHVEASSSGDEVFVGDAVLWITQLERV